LYFVFQKAAVTKEFDEKRIKERYLNSRKIFKQTMEHRQPDRIPMDIGGTTLTSMSPGCQRRLCEFLGIDKTLEPAEQWEEILIWAGTDFRLVGDIVQLPSRNFKKISDTEFFNCWGIQKKFVDNQWQIVNAPLKDASTDDLKNYPWPQPHVDEQLLEKWVNRAKELRKQDKYVVVAAHPYFGVLELGMWLCGYDGFLLRLALDPDFVKTFFRIICDLQLKIAKQYYSALGPYIDVTTSGDDFGMQLSPMLSPKMFDELIAPIFSERIAETKKIAKCYYWHHSCGSVYDLIENLISCGVDILNPVQTSASKMEPARLKDSFGDRIVFWGAVDVQHFLPGATVPQVKAHVKELAEVLGKDGGYVMAPAHNMQDDVPPENIAAWVQTVNSISKV